MAMTVNKQESQPDNEPDKSARSDSRRVWIMRGLVTPFLGLLAVASIALGLLNATVWKPSRQITATGSVSGVQYIATDPGVLPLVDRQATLTVKSDGNVCVALGSGKDIHGWIAGSQYVRVTGLSSWTGLALERTMAKGSSAGTDDERQAVAFKDSDMWSKVSCNTGTVSMKTDVENPATMALIDLGEAADASISLVWQRQTLPDFAMPFYFAGGLLAVMAVLTASLFAMPPHKRRKRVVERVVAEEVSIKEAIIGSWRTIHPKQGPAERSHRGRRRHATHRGTDTGTIPVISAVDEQTSGPTIVDPSSRNLVAETAQAAVHEPTPVDTQISHDAMPSDHDDAESSKSADESASTRRSSSFDGDNDAATSVITQEELMAYFARFAQESSGVNTGPAEGSQSHDESDEHDEHEQSAQDEEEAK